MTAKTKTEIIKLIKFSLVGVLNTLVDNLIFAGLLVLGLNRNVSKIISYSAATLHSYIWNKHWTFQNKEKKHGQLLSKFVVVNLISLGASLVVLNIFSHFGSWLLISLLGHLHLQVDLMKTSEILANLIVAGPVSILVNFLGNRLWVFRDSGTDKKGADCE